VSGWEDRRRAAQAPRDIPRLFVAVPIASEVVDRVGSLVAQVQAALGADGHRVRWVQMEGLHITLRFLGPTARAAVDTVAAAVDRAAAAVPGAFEVRVGGAGSFPDAGRPRSLWLGIRSGAPELGRLSAGLTDALAADGWALDERPFRPHLTIARTDGVASGAEAGRQLIAAAADLDASFTADRIVLYRSHLGHGPARYETLHAVPLA
jgi:RNA 2',3'-cyclic 3'-phosphodiesterase